MAITHTNVGNDRKSLSQCLATVNATTDMADNDLILGIEPQTQKLLAHQPGEFDQNGTTGCQKARHSIVQAWLEAFDRASIGSNIKQMAQDNMTKR